MAFVKSADRVATKYASVTPARSQEYADGVANPRVPWAQATQAAEANYKQAVTAAANAGRFGKGVAKSGDAKWQRGAKEKGTARFGAGVSLAKDAYQAGVAPYLDAIGRTTLPPRFPRRDPRNLDRVRVIATALGQQKESMGK